MKGNRANRRTGFTVLEIVVALGVLTSAMVLVAQLGTQALAERVRTDEQTTAVEAAANILETARTRTWADLTPEWAASLKLPDHVADHLPDVALTVRVEPEKERPRVKRVTVELHWNEHRGSLARTIATVGLFADRSAGGGS